MIARLLAVLCLLCLCATAVGAEETPPPAGRGDFTCPQALSTPEKSNAFTLLWGTVACAQANRQDDAAFLLLLGQMRGMTDMAILTPFDEDHAQTVGALYSGIFYQFGGLGEAALYRDPARVTALLARIKAFRFAPAESYDPGWKFKMTSRTDLYAQMLADEHAKQIWRINSQALLMQNTAYYEAHQAEAALQQKHKAYEVGTAAYAEHLRLRDVMAKAEQSIAKLPEPERKVRREDLIEQDADIAKQQLATGFNGPAKGGVVILRSAAAARATWLSRAMPEHALAAMLAKVDFARQVMVVVSLGQRENASGRVYFSALGYSKRAKGYRVSTYIGVIPGDCGVKRAASYPFLVGVAEAVAADDVVSQSTSNFGDKCGPVIAAEPTG